MWTKTQITHSERPLLVITIHNGNITRIEHMLSLPSPFHCSQSPHLPKATWPVIDLIREASEIWSAVVLWDWTAWWRLWNQVRPWESETALEGYIFGTTILGQRGHHYCSDSEQLCPHTTYNLKVDLGKDAKFNERFTYQIYSLHHYEKKSITSLQPVTLTGFQLRKIAMDPGSFHLINVILFLYKSNPILKTLINKLSLSPLSHSGLKSFCTVEFIRCAQYYSSIIILIKLAKNTVLPASFLQQHWQKQKHWQKF